MGKIQETRGLAVAALLIISLLVLPLVPNAPALAGKPLTSSAPKLRNIINQSSPYPKSYEGYVGDTLKLTGSNFTAESVVKFGTTAVVPFSQTKSNLSIYVPEVAPDQTYQVSVVNGLAITPIEPVGDISGLATSNVLNFRVKTKPIIVVPAAPQLDAITNQTWPLANYDGYVGDILQLTGSNFTASSVVKFDSAQFTPTFVSSGELLIAVPNVTANQTYAISVVDGTQSSNVLNFTVNTPTPVIPAAPELWAIANLDGANNYQGLVGNNLQLTGANFTSSSVVNFDSAQFTPTFVNSGQLLIAVPNVTADKTYAVSVTDGSQTSLSQNFYVVAPTPPPSPVTPELLSITNLDGTVAYDGLVGGNLRLTGTGFDQAGIEVKFVNSVSFAMTPAIPTSKTASEIFITIPNVTTNQTYYVSVTNGTSDSDYQVFFVNSAVVSTSTPKLLSITNLSGAIIYEARVGESIRLTGKNFDQAGIRVKFVNSATFAETLATPTSATSGEIIVTVPNVTANQTYYVSVTNGTVSSEAPPFFIAL